MRASHWSIIASDWSEFRSRNYHAPELSLQSKKIDKFNENSTASESVRRVLKKTSQCENRETSAATEFWIFLPSFNFVVN